ncbi:MAG: 50S ribosomal protein L35ae [Candidatus Parvarchaeota archaeon]
MKVLSYRRGRKTQTSNQAILRLDGVESREEASKYLGRKVEITFSKASIRGIITKVHGGKGRVVARFNRGLPGQIKNKDVKFVD